VSEEAVIGGMLATTSAMCGTSDLCGISFETGLLSVGHAGSVTVTGAIAWPGTVFIHGAAYRWIAGRRKTEWGLASVQANDRFGSLRRSRRGGAFTFTEVSHSSVGIGFDLEQRRDGAAVANHAGGVEDVANDLGQVAERDAAALFVEFAPDGQQWPKGGTGDVLGVLEVDNDFAGLRFLDGREHLLAECVGNIITLDLGHGNGQDEDASFSATVQVAIRWGRHGKPFRMRLGFRAANSPILTTQGAECQKILGRFIHPRL
jgi:hypothetical protein